MLFVCDLLILGYYYFLLFDTLFWTQFSILSYQRIYFNAGVCINMCLICITSLNLLTRLFFFLSFFLLSFFLSFFLIFFFLSFFLLFLKLSTNIFKSRSMYKHVFNLYHITKLTNKIVFIAIFFLSSCFLSFFLTFFFLSFFLPFFLSFALVIFRYKRNFPTEAERYEVHHDTQRWQ